MNTPPLLACVSGMASMAVEAAEKSVARAVVGPCALSTVMVHVIGLPKRAGVPAMQDSEELLVGLPSTVSESAPPAIVTPPAFTAMRKPSWLVGGDVENVNVAPPLFVTGTTDALSDVDTEISLARPVVAERELGEPVRPDRVTVQLMMDPARSGEAVTQPSDDAVVGLP